MERLNARPSCLELGSVVKGWLAGDASRGWVRHAKANIHTTARKSYLLVGLFLVFGAPRSTKGASAQAMTVAAPETETRPLARQAALGGTELHVRAVDRAPESQEPTLTLRVYNYAHLNRASLVSAERVATAIFESAHVETQWVDCPLSQAEYAAHVACQTIGTPTDIVLKILPRRMAEKLHMRDELLGFARPCSDSAPACEVTIFWYKVDDLATYGYRADVILGHAIAHEMAHVLTGGAHSAHGIMRRQWSRSELQKMSWGILLQFSDHQSAAVRSAAMRRQMAQREANQSAIVGPVNLRSAGAK